MKRLVLQTGKAAAKRASLPALAAVWFAGLCHPLPAQETESGLQSSGKLSVELAADYLALQVRITLPAEATRLEYLLSYPQTGTDTAAWVPVAFLGKDPHVRLVVPLADWPWTQLEVRAFAGNQALGTRRITPKPIPPLTLLTPERIALLSPELQDAWQSYLARSRQRAERERTVLAAECRAQGKPAAQAAPAAGEEFSADVKAPASPQTLALAAAVLSYQTPSGAWSKAIDFSAGTRPPGTQWTSNAGNPWHYCGTLDNGATSEQITFLARIHGATGRADAAAGAVRGLEWLLEAQFPNGGWPQVYPLERGYHEAITLNDDAMLHALEVLLAVSRGSEPFAFADGALRDRAAAAFSKGLACLLACQVKIAGQATVWCAQHDPLTLEPVAARLKEPPALSGGESANVLQFLMRKAPVTPETTVAIESGLAWIAAHRVTGLRKTRAPNGDPDYVADTASTEIYWARFYDLQTQQPIFAGAQDGRIYASHHEMAQHNRVAYAYFTTKPAELLGKEAARWKKRLAANRD